MGIVRRRGVLILVGVLVPTLLGALPARAERTFGGRPLDEVLAAAEKYRATCANTANRLSRNQLAALVLAPTFPETGAPTTAAPSPMTLSRWDNQNALYSFGDPTSNKQAFWHPGVGSWQWDDASLRGFTAGERIDQRFIVDFTTAYIANRWCSSPSLNTVWAPWHGCSSDRCRAIYHEIYQDGKLVGVNRDGSVGRFGGMLGHTCANGTSATFRCWYVDPARAQGYTGFAQPGFGPSPVTAPFYTFKSNGREHRHWLRADTGYAISIRASLPSGLNSRQYLEWFSGSRLCDLTRGVGLCDPLPPKGFQLQGASVNGQYIPLAGDFDGDGRADILWYGPGDANDSLWYGRNGGFRSQGITVRGTYRPFTGDFDGDGRDDVFWYGPGGDPDSIWYGHPDGFRSGSVSVRGSYEPFTGDFDGDGRDDAFWYGPGTAADSMWFGVGRDRWRYSSVNVSGTYAPFAGDFDGRGCDDVFWYGPGGDYDSIWTCRGDGTFGRQDATVNGVYAPMSADLDQDGRDDILWYAAGSVSDSLWYATSTWFRYENVRIDGDYELLSGDFDGARGTDAFFYRPGSAYDAIWWN